MNLSKFELSQVLDTEEIQTDSSSANLYENNNLSCPRAGENTTLSRFRANRLFSSGSAWYFSTREGREQGPFLNKEQAQKAIAEFIKKVKN